MMCAANRFSVGAIAAASILCFCISEAYAFDNNGFYPPKNARAPASRLEEPIVHSDSTNRFVLQQTGVVAEENLNQATNMPGFKKVDSEFEASPGQKSLKGRDFVNKMNTIGTDARQSAQPVCGPSPLSPGEIEDLVAEAAGSYGVDRGLATAIAWTESRFDRERNSPKGARGPMQLIPETAARYGVSDICDPRANIDAGVRHLRSLVDEFKNPLLAAAAYNAGEPAIYYYGGIPPYGETVRYVSAVINRQLGLQLPDNKPESSRQIPPREKAQANQIPGGMTGAGTRRFVAGVMQF